MLILLFEFLRLQFGIKIPAAFAYSSTRMILAALTTLVFTIFIGPWFIKKLYELKFGQKISRVEDCPVLAELHRKKKDTPTMGGILILISLLLALILWMDFKSPYTWILGLTTLWLGALGGIDDFLKLKYSNYKGLSAKKKYLGQLVLALFIGVYLYFPSINHTLSLENKITPPSGKEFVENDEKKVISHNLDAQEIMARFYIPFVKNPVLILPASMAILGVLWVVFIITGASNAVNFTDGLDGLASGVMVMVSMVLALVAFLSNNAAIAKYLNILYIEGSGEIATFLCAVAGACLGFLWYNGHPAQVFMGDIGSLALGGVIGVAAVLLRREFLLALSGGIFVVESLSVILQVLSYRYRNKKRIFLCAPLHHHFEYKGWPETKVVLRFWIVALILGLIALGSLKLQ